jgi:hypothetical protein
MAVRGFSVRLRNTIGGELSDHATKLTSEDFRDSLETLRSENLSVYLKGCSCFPPSPGR